MTIREYLARRKRLSMISAYSGFALFAIDAVIQGGANMLPVIGLVGLAVAFISVLYAVLALSCPKCHGRLGQLLTSVGGPLTVSAKLKYCPYCGVPLDSEMP